MNLHRLVRTGLLFTLFFATSIAYSHSRWDPAYDLKPRPYADGSYGDDLKVGPCGGLPRTNTPMVSEAGATILVRFESTIYHQGHFRIAFSPANDQGFDDNVLADNIPDYQRQRFRNAVVTLPNQPCERCTLQLIQTMPDRTPASNYFSCADIQLTPSRTPGEFVAMQQGMDINLEWQSDHEVIILQTNNVREPTITSGENFQLGDDVGAAKVIYRGSGRSSLDLPDRQIDKPYYFYIAAASAGNVYSAPLKATITLTEDPVEASGGALNWLLGIFALTLLYFRRKRSKPQI